MISWSQERPVVMLMEIRKEDFVAQGSDSNVDDKGTKVVADGNRTNSRCLKDDVGLFG